VKVSPPSPENPQNDRRRLPPRPPGKCLLAGSGKSPGRRNPLLSVRARARFRCPTTVSLVAFGRPRRNPQAVAPVRPRDPAEDGHRPGKHAARSLWVQQPPGRPAAGRT
jgi:hypothetical protein